MSLGSHNSESVASNEDNNSSVSDTSYNTTMMSDDDDESLHPDIELDALPSLFLRNQLRYEEMKHREPNKLPPEKFEYDNDLSATATCLAQILLTIEKRGGSKILFDEIVKVIFAWVKAITSSIHCGIKLIVERGTISLTVWIQFSLI